MKTNVTITSPAQAPGPALVIAALGDIARARGMMQLARETGLTREGLYKALSPEGNPSFATVMKVCKALGLKLQLHIYFGFECL